MRRLTVFLLALTSLITAASAQTDAPQQDLPTLTPAPSHPTAMGMLQVSLDRLTQSNRDLLDLLKKQQGVLEDLQFDRRLQSRQIQSLEERLQETLEENAKLQAKIATLETAAATAPMVPASPGGAPTTGAMPSAPPQTQVTDTPPPPPSTYLPPADPEGPPGTKSWHRLFTISGTEGRDSDFFHVQGAQWRVLWHNQDKEGKAYDNTSALFISAFPKDDTIPQKVCSKLGSGGDGTELLGPGNYYLKIEASGGSWELAVEDFR